ncbi:DUF4199 domain-containing protein [Brevibacterium casei]|nr:DUF4199 domain-containing protein [Brevibacterium casei]
MQRSDLWKRGRAAAGSASRAAAKATRRGTHDCGGLDDRMASRQGHVCGLESTSRRGARPPESAVGDPHRCCPRAHRAVVHRPRDHLDGSHRWTHTEVVRLDARGIGDTTGVEPVNAAADISTGLADALVAFGIIVGLVVIAAFCIYAWRVLVGRGHAKWVALIALVASLFVLTPFSPVLTAGFQIFATASLVFAFLPRSSAWFVHRRNRRFSR